MPRRAAGGNVADIERRLKEGEWLRIGDLMVLFTASRSMVDRWIRYGVEFNGRRIVIHYRLQPGGDRECDPRDISEVLAETRKIRSADDPDGTGDTQD